VSEEQRPRDQQQQQDEVEAHGIKSAENVEQGDEAATDDEVEAHRGIRSASPKSA
jgi:hypothetical protein